MLTRPITPSSPPRVSPGGRHAAIRAERAERARNRRNSAPATVALERFTIPARRQDSALGCYPQSAVTRVIYHHARGYLAGKKPDLPARSKKRRENPGWQVLVAVRRAARRVITETTVIKILQDAVEDRRQMKAKEAEDLWKKLLLEFPFFFECSLDTIPEDDIASKASTARQVADALQELLADFEGAAAVKERFLTVASSFRASASALRRLTASFGENLEGLQEMQSTIERCAEEALRLIRLFEGKVGDMRTQLRRTLRSRGARETFNDSCDAGSGDLLQPGAVATVPKNDDATDDSVPDCITSLLESLERDLCDKPVKTLHTATEDIAMKLVQSTGITEGFASKPGRSPSAMSMQQQKAAIPFQTVTGSHEGGMPLSERKSDRDCSANGFNPLSLLNDMLEVLKPSENKLEVLKPSENKQTLQVCTDDNTATSFVTCSKDAVTPQHQSLPAVTENQNTNISRPNSEKGLKVKAHVPLPRTSSADRARAAEAPVSKCSVAFGDGLHSKDLGAATSDDKHRKVSHTSSPSSRASTNPARASATPVAESVSAAFIGDTPGNASSVDSQAEEMQASTTRQRTSAEGSSSLVPSVPSEDSSSKKSQSGVGNGDKWWSMSSLTKNTSDLMDSVFISEDVRAPLENVDSTFDDLQKSAVESDTLARNGDCKDRDMSATVSAGQVHYQSVRDNSSGVMSLSSKREGAEDQLNESMAEGLSGVEPRSIGFSDDHGGEQATDITTAVDSTQDRACRNSVRLYETSAGPRVSDIESGTQRHRADRHTRESKLLRKKTLRGEKLEDRTSFEPDSFASPQKGSGGNESVTVSSSVPALDQNSSVETVLSRPRPHDLSSKLLVASENASLPPSRKSKDQRPMSPSSYARSFEDVLGSKNLAQTFPAHQKLMGMQSLSRRAGSQTWAPSPANKALAEVEEGPLQCPPPQKSPPSQQMPASDRSGTSSRGLLLKSRSMVLESRRGNRERSPPPSSPNVADGSATGTKVVDSSVRGTKDVDSSNRVIKQHVDASTRGTKVADGSAGGASSSSVTKPMALGIPVGNRRGRRENSPPPKVTDGSAIGKSPLAAAGRSLTSSASEPGLTAASMERVERVFKDRKFAKGNRSLAPLPPAAAPVAPVGPVGAAHTPDKHLSLGAPQQSCRPFDSRGSRTDPALRGLFEIDFQQYSMGAFPARNRLNGIRR